MKIAVVDDDPSIWKALQRLLQAEGFETAIFTPGAEFLASLTQEAPACLMLDLHLPGMSGLDVQRTLIESMSDLPMIVVTSVDDHRIVARALTAGARSG